MQVRVCVVAVQIEALQRAVRVQGRSERRERPCALGPDLVAPDAQGRESRVLLQGRGERLCALISDLVVHGA